MLKDLKEGHPTRAKESLEWSHSQHDSNDELHPLPVSNFDVKAEGEVRCKFEAIGLICVAVIALAFIAQLARIDALASSNPALIAAVIAGPIVLAAAALLSWRHPHFAYLTGLIGALLPVPFLVKTEFTPGCIVNTWIVLNMGEWQPHQYVYAFFRIITTTLLL